VDCRGIRHRLMGFDAPEIRQSQCSDERKRGVAARGRLEQLIVTAQSVELKPSRKLERYQRMLSTLYIDGENVADIAVREGWGMRYNGGREPRPDWCFAKLPPAKLPPSPRPE
jgi:micrococcal nuclease